MTEADMWDSINDHPRDLWEMVEPRLPEPAIQRKWRLAMSAFARRAALVADLELDNRTFEVLEARIDEVIPAVEFDRFRDCHLPSFPPSTNPTSSDCAGFAVAHAFGAVRAHHGQMFEIMYWQQAEFAFAEPEDEVRVQAAIVKDIFGNPFRPVAFDPRWRTEHTLGLALKMYEDRDFRAMPILADALEEAGCDSEAILTHCREPGVHVRGCWVVDLVLGKA